MRREGLVLLGLIILSGTFAKSYYYDSINTEVTILENGDLQVTETETLVFDGAFSYVYREFNSGVKDFKVTGDLTSYDKDGNKYTWYGQWTDTSKTFTLEYTITDPFRVTRNHDQLWHTLVFRDRLVPVNNAEANYHFPKPINSTNYRASSGIVTQLDEDTIKVTANSIPSYKAVDFEIYLNKGVINPPMSLKNLITLYPEIVNAIILAPILLFFILTIRAYTNYFKGRNKRKKDTMAYKEIRIESLPPAIAGLLVDYEVGPKEITATIIDLAIKGYIFIQKIVKQWWPDETLLIKVKSNYDKLNMYEKMIMRRIFKTKEKISFSELKKIFVPYGSSYHSTPLYDIQEAIKYEAVRLELTSKKIDKIITEKVWSVIKPAAISIALSFIHLIITFLVIDEISTLVIIPIGANFVFTMISLVILSILSTKLVKINAKGESARKTYINLRKMIKDQPLTAGRVFDTYLPYAIALGVQKKWMQKAEALGYDSNRDNWHSSNINMMGIIAINNSLNNSMVYTSSGGGGGGFGGGGGAGGGGGGAG